MNNIDNPSCFFDFSFLKQDYTYKFIMDNQHIFYDDIEHFDRVYVIPGTTEFVLNVAYDEYYHQSDKLLRVYIENIKKQFMFPVLVSDNTQFNNFEEYGISNTLANRFKCYISYNHDNIRKCTDGLLEPIYDLKECPYLFMWSDLFFDDDVSEHILRSSKTDLPIAIWIDENRMTSHGCRIKFQHNGSSDTNKWATLAFYEKNGTRHYEFLHDEGSTLTRKQYDLLQTFVEYNFEILMKLFDPKDKYNIKNFMFDYLKINVNNNSNESDFNKKYLKQHNYLKVINAIDNDLCIIINKIDKKQAVLYKGNILTNQWYDVIEYTNTWGFTGTIFNDEKDEEVWFDIYGNIIN